jgi:formylglycine-generating enzyme required for sulfatase activity
MVCISSSCFDMGDHFGDGVADELPVHEVCISDFEMDVHEVTIAEYAACVDAEGCTEPAYSTSKTRTTYYGDPAYDDFPVIHVSWDQATEYCAWAGKRLPTEAEWEYAARGGLAGKRYPWGGDTPGDVNADIDCGDANYARGDQWSECFDVGGLENDTHAVGTYPANGYGLYDMAGNVWEWVNDWWQVDYYSLSPTNDPPGPATGAGKVLRGGAYHLTPGGYPAFSNIRVADRYRLAPAVVVYPHNGFRCARGCVDSDGDGYGYPAQASCPEPDDPDCNDLEADIHPGAAPNDSGTDCMKDADGDDYGDDNPPAGVTPGTDCDDNDPNVHEGC